MARTRIEQSIALTRIIALAIADGDFKKAETYLDWAYGDNTVGQTTEKFIKKYLTPGKKISKKQEEIFKTKYIGSESENSGLDYDKIASAIRDMDYGYFLNTPYWKAVSSFVRERDGNRCRKCGSNSKLHIHHVQYINHGMEAKVATSIDDLICLCEKCHAKEHNKDS